MRGLAIAGVLLLGGSLALAQENADRGGTAAGQSGNWFSRFHSGSTDTSATKKTSAAAKKSEPSAAENAASRRTREEVILNRRNEVILKLREIAQRTADDALMRKADDLQEQAWDLYLQKTANLAGGLQEARR